ncbi:hypothetical protein PMSD_20660 [Paenibacillus macquariensis subsp. defensor]|nr:hypothetical protein PMSD_20660 [Paenibacillus macquariensis subsp. defensor]
MSLCICLQNSEKLIIVADTALVIKQNGELLRFRKPFEKLVQVENFLIFMSGSADVACNVLERFPQESFKTIHSLQKVVINSCRNFSISHPEVEASLDEATRGVAVFAAEYANGGVIVHTIQPSDGFEIHSYTASDSETRPHAGGVLADEALSLLDPFLRKGGESVPKMIEYVFNELSGAEIGGMLTIAVLDKNGIEFMPPRSINENVRLRYYEDVFNSFRGSICLTGSLIQTAETGIFPRAEMSNTNKMFKVASSSNSSVEMRSSGSNALSDIYFKTGSAHASMSLPSASTGLLLDGDKLTAEFLNIYLRGYLGVSVPSWDTFKSVEDGESILNALDKLAINLTFDDSTRNLKLWSKGRQLLAQVNIPK